MRTEREVREELSGLRMYYDRAFKKFKGELGVGILMLEWVLSEDKEARGGGNEPMQIVRDGKYRVGGASFPTDKNATPPEGALIKNNLIKSEKEHEHEWELLKIDVLEATGALNSINDEAYVRRIESVTYLCKDFINCRAWKRVELKPEREVRE